MVLGQGHLGKSYAEETSSPSQSCPKRSSALQKKKKSLWMMEKIYRTMPKDFHPLVLQKLQLNNCSSKVRFMG